MITKNKEKIWKFSTAIISFLLLILIANISSAAKLDNPLNVEDVPTLIARIIKGILGIVGSISLLMFIYGGITWMTAGGNEEKVKKAKSTISSAVLGLVVIFGAYSVLNLVFEILTTA